MATNNAFKVTKDISARKSGRAGSVQSNVEAAATRSSHEAYVAHLTEGYRQQIEAMEHEYEEQISDLGAKLTASAERERQG